MKISFKPLNESHFPLLLKWLETPHVKAWWDQDVKWTPKLIKEKYGNYVQGVKNLKPIHAFIMCVDDKEIGYIQYYNVYDFPREQGYPRVDHLASIDLYIGEVDWIGRGIGPRLMKDFLNEFIFQKFEACFVDPDTANKHAIRAYEKAGFKQIKVIDDGKITWMVKFR